jgi:hypothetical protein
VADLLVIGPRGVGRGTRVDIVARDVQVQESVVLSRGRIQAYQVRVGSAAANLREVTADEQMILGNWIGGVWPFGVNVAVGVTESRPCVSL